MLARIGIPALIALGLFIYMQGPTSKAATITQSCSDAAPGTVSVSLAWKAPKPGAQQTWLDVSLVKSFTPGWFQGHGPLDPAAASYVVDGVPLGAKIYYRVNVLSATGWHEQASGSFTSACPVPGTPAAGAAAKPAIALILQQLSPDDLEQLRQYAAAIAKAKVESAVKENVGSVGQ
jgi:hypothetical protein